MAMSIRGRWWLAPKEVAASIEVHGRVLPLTFEGDDGALWHFRLGAEHIAWDHSAHSFATDSTLQDNGFARANLYMTWDFTVASEHSLTNRALSMRDDALPPEQEMHLAFEALGFDSLSYMEFCIAIQMETGLDLSVGKMRALGTPR